MYPEPKSKLTKWLWIILIISVIGVGGFIGWYYLLGPGKAFKPAATPSPTPSKTSTPAPSPTATATATPKPSPSPSPTATASTYTNSKYGFSMTFPANWKGYKMKEATFDGSLITYYVNVPTTDSKATGSTDADAGFYSPFAITVYTIAQWNALQTVEGPKDIYITKNDKYVFAWSHANGIAPDDFGNRENDIANIITSLKLQ